MTTHHPSSPALQSTPTHHIRLSHTSTIDQHYTVELRPRHCAPAHNHQARITDTCPHPGSPRHQTPGAISPFQQHLDSAGDCAVTTVHPSMRCLPSLANPWKWSLANPSEPAMLPQPTMSRTLSPSSSVAPAALASPLLWNYSNGRRGHASILSEGECIYYHVFGSIQLRGESNGREQS